MNIMYDTDMGYCRVETMDYQPAWVKAERLDYCERAVESKKGFVAMIKSVLSKAF